VDELGGEVDAGFRRPVEANLADRRLVIVHPQERQRILELDAERIDDVAHAIDRGGRGRARDNPPLVVDGLDLETRIGAIMNRSPSLIFWYFQTISMS
jgi:hypothetical protein